MQWNLCFCLFCLIFSFILSKKEPIFDGHMNYCLDISFAGRRIAVNSCIFRHTYRRIGNNPIQFHIQQNSDV